MDLPTPLKTLPFRAFALRVRALPALALALALTFGLAFASSWSLLDFVPAVVLLLLLLLLQLLRCQLLPGTSAAFGAAPCFVHSHGRERADEAHPKQRGVSARPRRVKAVFMLLTEISHEFARARIRWQLIAVVLRPRPNICKP